MVSADTVEFGAPVLARRPTVRVALTVQVMISSIAAVLLCAALSG